MEVFYRLFGSESPTPQYCRSVIFADEKGPKQKARNLKNLDTASAIISEPSPKSATPKSATRRSSNATPSTPVRTSHTKASKVRKPTPDRPETSSGRKRSGKPRTPTTKELISKKRLRTRQENRFNAEKENEKRLSQKKTYYTVLRSGKEYRSLGGWLN